MQLSFARSAALSILVLAGAAHGQGYPAKPVRVVVAYPAGGSIDIVGRMVGQKLAEAMGQQFVIENRAGASGNIGTDYVAKAPPDGYTLLMGSAAALASNVNLYTKLPFDPLRDFAPIILVVNQPNVMVLHPSVPAKSVKEFIALAKARPGKLNYATSGSGSTQHMSGELFIMMTGVNIVHVPYKGGAPALNDLVGGQVDLSFETVPTAMQFVHAGKLRALGVTSLRRSGMLPDVPTLDEAGLRGYELRGWIGLLAPAGTPKEIVARLNGEAQKAASGELRKRLTELGLDVAGGTPEQFAAFMREDIAKYAKLVKASGIPLQ